MLTTADDNGISGCEERNADFTSFSASNSSSPAPVAGLSSALLLLWIIILNAILLCNLFCA